MSDINKWQSIALVALFVSQVCLAVAVIAVIVWVRKR